MNTYKTLREEVYEQNMELHRRGVVLYTWGNVSALDEGSEVFAIKPSGVRYEDMTPHDIVVLDLEGNVVFGEKKPSSDTPTHRALYRAFPAVRAVVHTHSTHATAFAQAAREIPALGTTHADSFYGPVPVTRALTRAEIASDYEWNTGIVIIERFHDRDPSALPAVLVSGHGPFAWGPDAAHAVQTAVILEEVARIAALTLSLSPCTPPIDQALLDKHFLRKHGKNAYYGQ